MVKVSVIVPVYNSFPYIEKCIRSILSQTLKEIQIIVVNDGSEDGSLSVIRRLEKEDKRIIVINGFNKGVSAARNKGLEIARGEWIGFVDADDWIQECMFETLYNRAIKSGAGVAICNLERTQEGKPPVKSLTLNEGTFEFAEHPEHALEQMVEFRFDYSNCNKIYKREIINKNSLSFDEHIRIGEDLLFNLYYLHFIQRIVIVDQAFYQCWVHANSVMANSENIRIEQYNLQFEAYKNFAEKHRLVKEWEMFRKLMARGFYNTLIPAIIKNIKKTGPGYFQLVEKLSAELGKLKYEIYYFPHETEAGLQVFKKRLLKYKHFRLFAMLVALKHA